MIDTGGHIMNSKIQQQSGWWEREKTAWSGDIFNKFALKEDNYREKRIQFLREEIVEGNDGKRGEISIERARLLTESYKSTEGEVAVIRRAKAFKHVLENIPIYVPEGQLLMGYPSAKKNGVEIEPEFHSSWLLNEVEINGKTMREIDSIPIREFIEFHFKAEDKRELENEIIPYWKDQTLHAGTIKILEQYNPEAIYYWDNSFTSFPVTRIGLCHTIQDYRGVVYGGYRSFRDEIEKEIEKITQRAIDDFNMVEKLNNYRAMLIVLEGVITYAQRCADLAEKMALEEQDPDRVRELKIMAKNCRKVPENPAENWWEAMQAIHFAHMITWLTDAGVSHSMGRFDIYMMDILKKDMDNGLSREEAQELLECFMVTFCYRNQLVDWRGSRATPGWHTNDKITIGGIDVYGRDSTNLLSYMILEGHAHIHLNDPIISVRLHNNTPDDFLISVMEILRTSGGVPQIINDEAIIPGLMGQLGMSWKEARNYADVGCQENQSDPNTSIGVDTHGHQNAGYFDLVKPIELALNNGTNPRNGISVGPKTGNADEFKTIEEFAEAVKQQFEYAVKMNVIINNMIEYSFYTFVPTPYHNLMHPGPRKTGTDMNKGGCKYNYVGAIGTGLGTAADSMAAIEKVVFQDRICTLGELVQALDANWDGYEELRAECIGAPKYGTDNDIADGWAKFISDTFMNAYEEYPTMRGGKYLCGFFSVTQNHVLGEDVDATPDGRYSKEMLSDTVAPSQYADQIGPTATHKSHVKGIDTLRTVNGITFAQNMDLNSLKTKRELSKWGDLIRTFISEGGQSVQYNVVSLDVLKDAKIHPERHKGLFVRIGGYTARFVDLSEVMQDSVINKAIQSC